MIALDTSQTLSYKATDAGIVLSDYSDLIAYQTFTYQGAYI